MFSIMVNHLEYVLHLPAIIHLRLNYYDMRSHGVEPFWMIFHGFRYQDVVEKPNESRI